jgi:hypothetical protein
MLLPLAPGLIVNTDTIRSIKEGPAAENGRKSAEVTFTDGTRKIVNQPVEHFDWCAGPIIPAPPGYSVIQAFPPEKEGEETTFAAYPVIAFRVTDREPLPVTPFGKLDDHWALVWPDGRCDEQWNRLFPTVEDFKASFGPRGERT